MKLARQTFIIGKNQSKVVVIDKSGEYHIILNGEGAHAVILGLMIGNNSDEFIINTIQHHKAKNTTSDLLIKSVLFDKSKLHYDGLIKIEKAGQGSDAYQRNENLLMNQGVRVDTKPELEILANSVRCTHGATVGKIDKEQLFYLESRGLSTVQSQKLIIEGFLEGVLDRIKDEKMKNKYRRLVSRKIS